MTLLPGAAYADTNRRALRTCKSPAGVGAGSGGDASTMAHHKRACSASRDQKPVPLTMSRQTSYVPARVA